MPPVRIAAALIIALLACPYRKLHPPRVHCR
jgi:hypothetical protein